MVSPSNNIPRFYGNIKKKTNFMIDDEINTMTRLL